MMMQLDSMIFAYHFHSENENTHFQQGISQCLRKAYAHKNEQGLVALQGHTYDLLNQSNKFKL